MAKVKGALGIGDDESETEEATGALEDIAGKEKADTDEHTVHGMRLGKEDIRRIIDKAGDARLWSDLAWGIGDQKALLAWSALGRDIALVSRQVRPGLRRRGAGRSSAPTRAAHGRADAPGTAGRQRLDRPAQRVPEEPEGARQGLRRAGAARLRRRGRGQGEGGRARPGRSLGPAAVPAAGEDAARRAPGGRLQPERLSGRRRSTRATGAAAQPSQGARITSAKDEDAT